MQDPDIERYLSAASVLMGVFCSAVAAEAWLSGGPPVFGMFTMLGLAIATTGVLGQPDRYFRAANSGVEG